MASHQLSPELSQSYHPATGRLSERERKLVRDHLKDVLASSVFRNSRRYAAVLAHVVERALEGNDFQLKERTIGVEVFGRTPDYDTATDHVVRSAVAEIRKRLAQFYQDPVTRAEVKIEIQPGSYIPQFHFVAEAPPTKAENKVVEITDTRTAQRGNRFWPRLGAIASIATLATVFSALAFTHREDAEQRFWGPLLATHSQVLVCVGNLAGGHQAVIDPLAASKPVSLSDFHNIDSEMVHFDDALTLARIAGFLEAANKPYRIQSQTQATYTDLQTGPAVLIGLMNNDWTERLVSSLRFSVEHPSPKVLLIRDHDHPERNDWSVDYSRPYLDISKDYALIVRVSDPKTDQMVVTIAGLSVFGTVAAGEFVTSAHELKKLDSIAPKNWTRKNVELVLSTDVIRGEVGHPTIVAARFW